MSANFTDGRIPAPGEQTWRPLASYTAPHEPIPGMTLRDWYIGQALIGLLAGQYRDNSRENFTTLPVEACAVADAVLAARSAGAPAKEADHG